METLRMDNSYARDQGYEPSFDAPFTPDNMIDFDADSGIFDISGVDFNKASAESMNGSCSSYPCPEYSFDTTFFACTPGYTTANVFPEFETLPDCQALEVPVTQGLGTCQLSTIAPVSESFYQSTSSAPPPPPPSTTTYPDLENDSRSRSERLSSDDSSYAHSSIPVMGSDDASRSRMSMTDEASQESTNKPRKKRGRKRANVSDEVRRSRKLERGRIAANKCRQKKRAREHELESKGLQLVIERDQMLKLNQELRDEIMGLQFQIMKHVGGECDGIPNAEKIVSSLKIPSERLDEAHRREGNQLKKLLGNQAL